MNTLKKIILIIACLACITTSNNAMNEPTAIIENAAHTENVFNNILTLQNLTGLAALTTLCIAALAADGSPLVLESLNKLAEFIDIQSIIQTIQTYKYTTGALVSTTAYLLFSQLKKSPNFTTRCFYYSVISCIIITILSASSLIIIGNADVFIKQLLTLLKNYGLNKLIYYNLTVNEIMRKSLALKTTILQDSTRLYTCSAPWTIKHAFELYKLIPNRPGCSLKALIDTHKYNIGFIQGL